jgi:hypothetical protein
MRPEICRPARAKRWSDIMSRRKDVRTEIYREKSNFYCKSHALSSAKSSDDPDTDPNSNENDETRTYGFETEKINVDVDKT